MSDLYGSLRGHQLTTYHKGASKSSGNVKYKADEINCTCGWKIVRPRVLASFNEKTGKSKMKDEPLVIFRARGPQHLYQVWADSRQGRLEL
jgi:hypothetical protein